MNLALPIEMAAGYRSCAQKARVVTESWAAENLYCPACPSDALARTRVNTRAVDLICEYCGQTYQLKSKSSSFGSRVVDGAYAALMQAVANGATPNLLLLQYGPEDWTISELTIIPAFALTPSAIERRRPLAPTARRAGWVGCNILLARLPHDVRISIVTNARAAPRSEVRTQYRRLLPLARRDAFQRGWTLDVLNIVRRLGVPEFSNEDVYAHTDELRRLHPGNRHVTDKIRQQLQVLRDAGFLRHVRRGSWQVVQ